MSYEDAKKALDELGAFIIPEGAMDAKEAAAVAMRVAKAAAKIEAGTAWADAVTLVLKAALDEL